MNKVTDNKTFLGKNKKALLNVGVKLLFRSFILSCLFLKGPILLAQNTDSFYPLKSYQQTRITSDFGLRGTGFHKGIDLDGFIGDHVFVWRNGYVVDEGYSATRGNYVIVSHSKNFVSLYYHLSEIDVNRGATVKGGEKIGEVGNTGSVSSNGGDGSHLHFEIRHNNKPIDPKPFLAECKSPSNAKIIDNMIIAIASYPSYKSVYIDNKYIGRTPITKNLKFGNHSLRIDGDGEYDDVFSSLNISNSSKSEYYFSLKIKKRDYVYNGDYEYKKKSSTEKHKSTFRVIVEYVNYKSENEIYREKLDEVKGVNLSIPIISYSSSSFFNMFEFGTEVVPVQNLVRVKFQQ